MTTIDASIWLDPHKAQRAVWPWVVAGGALRDSWVGAEPKDIDVFMWTYRSTFKDYSNKGQCYINAHGDLSSGGVKFVKGGSEAAPVGEFASFTSADMPGVNLIILPWPEGVEGDKNVEEELNDLVPILLETFPCSLAQVAWWPGNDTWWTTSKFEHTMREKIVVVEWCDNGEQYYNEKIKHHPVFGKWVTKYERW